MRINTIPEEHIINYGRGGNNMLVGGSQNFYTLLWGDHKIPGVQNGGITKFPLNQVHNIDFYKVAFLAMSL